MNFTSNDTSNTEPPSSIWTLMNVDFSDTENDPIQIGNATSTDRVSDANKKLASEIFEDLSKSVNIPPDRYSQIPKQNIDADYIDNLLLDASNNNKPNTDGALYSLTVDDTEAESLETLVLSNSFTLLASDSRFQACSLTAPCSTSTMPITADNQEQKHEHDQEEHRQEEHQQEKHQQEKEPKPEQKSEAAAIIDSRILSNNTSANQQSEKGKNTEHRHEKPLNRCIVCGKSFGDSSKLRQHMRIHTGEKPYPCPTCDRTFRQKIHLYRHVATHSEDKPFSCTICGISYRHRASITQHSYTHTKPFGCTLCGKRYARNWDLKKHVAKCLEQPEQN